MGREHSAPSDDEPAGLNAAQYSGCRPDPVHLQGLVGRVAGRPGRLR